MNTKVNPEKLLNSKTKNPYAILIVEDDKGVAQLIESILYKAGFSAELVTTGSAAIAYVMEHSNSLLLLDYFLPDMTGKEIIESLHEFGKTVPFIVITGQGSEKIAVDMMKLGACDYLVKGKGFQDLLPLVLTRIINQLVNETQSVLSQQELKLLDDLHKASLSGQPLEQILDKVSRSFSELIRVPSVTIYLYDKVKHSLLCQNLGLQKALTDKIEKLTGVKLKDFAPILSKGSRYNIALESGKGFIESDKNRIVSLYGEFTNNAALKKLIGSVMKITKVQSVGVIPLITHSGPLGLITYSSETVLQKEALKRLDRFGREVATILDSVRAEKTLLETNAHLQMLQQLTTTIHTTLNLEEVFKQITDGIVDSPGYTTAIVIIRNDEKNTFELKAMSTKWILPEIDQIVGFPINKLSFAADPELNHTLKSAMEGNVVIARTLTEIAYPIISKKMCLTLQSLRKTKKYIVVPLKVEKKVVGGILISSRQEEVLEGELAIIETFADIASQAIKNATLHTQTKRAEKSLKKRHAEVEQLLGAEQKQIQQISGLVDVVRQIRVGMSKTEIFRQIAEVICDNLNWQTVAITRCDADFTNSRFITGVGLPNEELKKLKRSVKNTKEERPSFKERFLQEKFKISRSYFIPEEAGGTELLKELNVVIAKVEEYTPGEWKQGDFLLVPILNRESNALGIITVDRPKDGHRPDKETVRILELFADQVAVAIENIGLYQEAKQEALHSKSLMEVTNAINSTMSVDELLDLIVEKVLELTDSKRGALFLFDDTGKTLSVRASRGISDKTIPNLRFNKGESIAGWVAETGKGVLIYDVENHQRFKPMDSIKRVSMINVPLMVRRKVIGVIGIDRLKDEEPFTEHEFSITQDFANQASLALEKTRLFSETQQRSTRLQKLYDLSVTLTGDTQSVFDKIVGILVELFDVPIATVEELSGDNLIIRSMFLEGDTLRGDVYPSRGTPFENVRLTKKTCAYTDAMNEFPEDSFLEKYNIRSYIGVPIFNRERNVVGVLNIMDTRKRSFTDEDIELLYTFSDRIYFELEEEQRRKEQEQMLQALTKSEERYRSIFENTILGVFRSLPEGRFTHVNPALVKMLGYDSSEEVLGLKLPEDLYVNPTQRQKLRDKYEPIGSMEGVEIVWKKKGGEPIVVSLNVRGVCDAQGNIVHYEGMVLDITKRKQAEESIQQLSAFPKENPHPVLSTDLKGKVKYANPAATQILEEIGGKRRNITWLLPRNRKKLIEEALKEKKVVMTEEYERGNGVFVCQIHIPEGSNTAHLYLTEVTKQVQQEEISQRLLTAVEHAADSIIITNAKGAIQYVNPLFEQTSGYSRKEVIGQNLRRYKSGLQDYYQYREIWNIIASGQVWSGRLSHKNIDGHLYEEETSISPIRDKSGKIHDFVFVCRDITQKIALEEQLRQSQKLEAIGQLAGGIAHDFNNILTGIIGYSDLALVNLPKEHELRNVFNAIIKKSDDAAILIRQLLAFSRKQILDIRLSDLNHILKHTAQFLERVLRDDIKLIMKLNKSRCSFNADTTAIQQIITNLCVNAQDAMPFGGEITISTSNVSLDESFCSTRTGIKPGEYIKLSVSDTGTGIEKDISVHIYEPFFTTKEVGVGTGLGLSTVYGLVGQHNGYIECISTPGKGTVFELYFPQMKKAPHQKKAVTTVEKVEGNETILIVEDDIDVLNVLKNILNQSGYGTLIAKNGSDGLKILTLKSKDIDLVITDIYMPEMSGIELFKKTMELGNNMQFLFITGHATQEIKSMTGLGLELLQKPFTSIQLTQKIREILDN